MPVGTVAVDVGGARRLRPHPPARAASPPAVAALRAMIDRPAWLAGLVVVLIALPVSESGENSAEANITPADLAASLLVLLIAAQVVTGRLRVPLRRPLVLGAGAMALAGGLAALTADDQLAAIMGWARFTEIFVLVPIAVALSIRARADALRVVLPLVAVGLLEGAIGVRQHLAGTGASYGLTDSRAIGTFGAYDIMGMSTVVGCTVIVLAAVALVVIGPVRWLAAAGAAALLAPLAFSYSRGAWIGTTVGVAVVLLAAGWRRGVVVLCGVGLAAVLSIGSMPASTNSLGMRLNSITSALTDPDTSVNDRYGLWTASAAMWRDHPLTGVGIKNFAHYRDRYAPVSISPTSDIADQTAGFRRVELLSPHSLYLLVLSEQGIVGVLAYGSALLALLIAGLRRAVRASRDRLERLLGVVAAGYGAWFLVTSLYGDPGGPTTLLSSVLLGVAVWWAHGQVLRPAAGAGPWRAVKRRLSARPLPPVRSVAGDPGRRALSAGLLRGRSRVALGVAVLTTLASVLGLVRDLTIARFFGASADTDAFLVAWTVPETATPLLMEGVMGLFLVPFMARALHRDGSLAPTVSRTLPTVLAVLSAASILLACTAPWCVRLLAPGLAEPDLAVASFRVAAFTVLPLALCGYFMSVLKASSSFLVPASVNIAWNIGIIAAIAALSATLGIYSAAIGLAVGGAAMALVQVPAVIRNIGVPRLRWTVSRALLARSVIVLPVAAYAITRQAQTYAERFFGSQLAPGAISHLNYAFKVGQMAVMVSLVAGWVAFPAMARAALTDGNDALAGKLQRELRIAIGLVLPQIAALVLFAPRVISLLFGHGQFGPADTRATAVILQVMALGLVGQTVLNIVVLFLFAVSSRDRSPAVAAGMGLAVTVAVDALAYRSFGAPALAAGGAAGVLVSAGVVLRAVRLRAIPLDLRALGAFLARCALATTAGGAAAIVAEQVVPDVGTDLLPLMVGAVALFAVYAYVLLAVLPNQGDIRVSFQLKTRS
ncbi:MAG: lipid II flippase MurJ [Micromonospora sp.]